MNALPLSNNKCDSSGWMWLVGFMRQKIKLAKENNTAPCLYVLVIVKEKPPWKMEMSDKFSYCLKTGAVYQYIQICYTALQCN